MQKNHKDNDIDDNQDEHDNHNNYYNCNNFDNQDNCDNCVNHDICNIVGLIKYCFFLDFPSSSIVCLSLLVVAG